MPPWNDAEKRRAKNREWTEKNRERRRAIGRAYWTRHRDEINRRRRARYAEQHPPEEWE